MKGTEASVTMNGGSSSKQDKGKSVFTLITGKWGNFRGSLYELKLDPRGLVMGGCEEMLVPVAQFFDKSYDLLPFYSMNGVCIGSKFYLLISRISDQYYTEYYDGELPATEKHPPLNGFIFDLKTKELVKFSPPRADKPHGIVVYAFKKIYFLLDVAVNPYLEKDSFERYDPSTDSWESLNPFPYSEYCARSRISGYLIYEGSILFSIIGHKKYSVMAYYENRNCWEPVHVEDSRKLSWSGQAVVLDNTIYALSLFPEDVITFRVKMDQTDEGGVSFTLSKSSKLYTLEMELPSRDRNPTAYMTHMGGKQFCVVKTGCNYDKQQPLSIITFQIEEGDKIKVSDSTTRNVDSACHNLNVALCFSVQCEDIGCNGDNTTLMNQQHQEAGPIVKHVGVEDSGSSGSSELSTTQTGMVRSRWTMNKTKAVTLYGLIPLVIIMGIKVSKPALTRLLKHD